MKKTAYLSLVLIVILGTTFEAKVNAEADTTDDDLEQIKRGIAEIRAIVDNLTNHYESIRSDINSMKQDISEIKDSLKEANARIDSLTLSWGIALNTTVVQIAAIVVTSAIALIAALFVALFKLLPKG